MKPDHPYKDYPDPIDDAPEGGTPDGKGAKGGGKATKVTWLAIGIVAAVFAYAVFLA